MKADCVSFKGRMILQLLQKMVRILCVCSSTRPDVICLSSTLSAAAESSEWATTLATQRGNMCFVAPHWLDKLPPQMWFAKRMAQAENKHIPACVHTCIHTHTGTRVSVNLKAHTHMHVYHMHISK